MTKTKAQLRAEAVERLRWFESSDEGDGYYWDVTWALLGKRPTEYDDSDELVSALIDLLTDDDANDGSAPENIVSCESADVTTGKRSKTEHDGVGIREKLEADANGYVVSWWQSGLVDSFAHADSMKRDIMRLLDRQASITEREIFDEMPHVRDKIAELQAENEKLKRAKDIGWEAECRLQAERDEWKAKALGYEHRLNLELSCSDKSIIDALESRNRELTAECDKWKAEVDAYRGEYEGMEFIVSIDEAMKFTTDPPGYVKKALADLQAERDELKAENKLLRERKCPGYDPDRHYCEYHAQDFELNSKTVRTLKQDRKKLIDILTNIGVEVRDDEFGLSFMYDNYHNLGSENERLGEQLIDARKARDRWRRVAGKHAAEIQRLKRGLEAERELARMWPRYSDGRPVRVGDTVSRKVGSIEFFEDSVELRGIDHTCICRDLFGTHYDYPPLKGKDGAKTSLAACTTARTGALG